MAAITRATRIQRARVANGANDSEVYQAENFISFGVITPATIDGTQMRFKVSRDNSTFIDLYDEFGTQRTITIAANRGIPLPDELAAWKFFKLVQVTAAGADRDYYITGKS
jgi:hypothetical protein